MTADRAGHPHKRPAVRVLLFSLAAAPAGWIIQLVLSYGVASYACQPTGAPGLRPSGFGWDQEHWLFLAINLVCLAAAIASGIAPWRAWRVRATEPTGTGDPKTAVHARFLAVCGLMASAGFTIAIAFNSVELFTVPACWRIVG